ncbi:hypothetical protein Dsin_016674 [Dipteronia sinensis]|uniref:Uncharacterized protein n=1 Tax=Dipteronia sinensis TaxID=43782 RepID=A0AAE0AEB1_9ROSI|nr:hypothetical protein Dsin_016674 [Dipteronia sinensis]
MGPGHGHLLHQSRAGPDDITQEKVFDIGSEGDMDKKKDQPNWGTAFKLDGDGRIKLECGVIVPDHTLYRTKKYALKIGEGDHKQSYNKLYRYGHIILERNPGSYVKLSTIRNNPNPQVPANFQGFDISFQAQKWNLTNALANMVYGLSLGFHIASTSTAPPKGSKRKRNEAGRNSIPTSGLLGLASTHDGTATTTALGGSSTTAAPTHASGTITRVI